MSKRRIKREDLFEGRVLESRMVEGQFVKIGPPKKTKNSWVYDVFDLNGKFIGADLTIDGLRFSYQLPKQTESWITADQLVEVKSEREGAPLKVGLPDGRFMEVNAMPDEIEMSPESEPVPEEMSDRIRAFTAEYAKLREKYGFLGAIGTFLIRLPDGRPVTASMVDPMSLSMAEYMFVDQYRFMEELRKVNPPDPYRMEVIKTTTGFGNNGTAQA